MFKFLKSKKGFTLVELMIVVVIMAILVAVAVPIYNSVTSKARIKTCTANQREIVSQLNSAVMNGDIKVAASKSLAYTLTTAKDKGTWATVAVDTAKTSLGTETLTADSANQEAGLTLLQSGKLFQKEPYCPIEGAVITVVVKGGDDSGSATIIAGCNQADHVKNSSTASTN